MNGNKYLQKQFAQEVKQLENDYLKTLRDLERKEDIKRKVLISKYKAKGLEFNDIMEVTMDLLEELKSKLQ